MLGDVDNMKPTDSLFILIFNSQLDSDMLSKPAEPKDKQHSCVQKDYRRPIS